MYQSNSLPIEMLRQAQHERNCYIDTFLDCYIIEKVILFQSPLHNLVRHRYKGYTMHIFYPASEVP